MADLSSYINITANTVTTSNLSATGNITSNSVLSTTGNVTGNYFIGNGSQLTGLAANYGNANVVANLAALGSNPVSTTGNITGGNILNNGLISSTGNSTAANYLTIGIVSATGNATVANLITAGSNGNIFGANNISANSFTATYTPASTTGSGILSQGANTQGGTGYYDFLKATNQSGGATNSSKSFRINSTGAFEIINSAYTSTLFSIADNGNTIVAGNLQVTGNLTYVNTTNLSVTNALITLANAATLPSQANGGGIQLNGANANIIYTSGNDAWNINKPLAVTGAITGTTTISAAGNITGGNILNNGLISSTGNSTAANYLTGGLVSATGNVTGNYVLGNGALLTGVITSVANINSGTSNVTVVSSGGNITVGVGGISNVAVFATTGEYVTGVVSASGNIVGGNIITAGLITATGNITGGNVAATSIAGTLTTAAQTNITSVGTLGALTVTANVTGGNVLTGGVISSTGNITGGNISATTHTGTTVSVTGNVTAGNVINTGISSVTGNVTAGNVLTAGQISATGNVTTANYFVGNLVGTTASMTGNVYAGNVIINGQPTTYGTVSPDYIQVEKSADQASVAKNADINFNVTTATNGGIAFASNIFTLIAGKTYLLEATLCTNTFTSTSAFIWYSWVDATTNAQLDTSNGAATSTGSSGVAIPATWTANDNYSSTARLIYTPNTNQTVKIRATDGSGTCTVLAIGTRATITQLNPTIAVQATATGTVNNQYSSVTLTSNQVIGSPGTPTNIVFQSATGTVPYNTSTGVWTLTSGVTYNLTAVLAVTGASNYLGYQWVDSVSGTALSTALGFATLATTQVSSVPLSIVYTPNTNQTIALRNVNGQYASVIANYSWATVTQINQAFALNALDTMTTTGNVSVGGNLTVTGGIRKSARVLTTTTTLTVADASGFIEFNSGPYTVTLPDPTQAANSGIGYRFWQNTVSNITLSTPAGGFYGPSGNSGASTKVLAQATTQYWDVWSDGYNWSVFGIKIA
jgi:hypothetical protein